MLTVKMLMWDAVRVWRGLLMRDLRFFLLAAFTFGLGIFASTTMFALIETFVLRTPPFADPGRLAMIGAVEPSGVTTMSPQQFQLLPALSDFEAIGATSFRRFDNLATQQASYLVSSRPVTRSFLAVLGIRMLRGRNFTPTEDTPAGAGVIIVSQRFWMNTLGADPQVIGRILKLEGKPVTVIGVLPETFQFMEPLDLLTPLGLPTTSNDNGNHLTVIGRLAGPRGISEAGAAVEALMQAHAAELGIKPADHQKFSAESLQSSLAGPARSTVLMFFAFGVCLLGLVIANVSNLFLVRSITIAARNAVRSALGASALRLAGPAAAEALLVAAAGAAAGLIGTLNALPIVNTYVPEYWMNASGGAVVGPQTYLWAAVATLVATLFMITTALSRRGQRSLVTDLATGQRIGWNAQMRKFGRNLLIAQVALACSLVFVGTSFLESLQRLLGTSLGIDAKNVLTFSIQASREKYPTPQALRGLARDMLTHLEGQAQTVKAAAALNAPIGDSFAIPVRVSPSRVQNVEFRAVTPNYFGTLGIPLTYGRDFGLHDSSQSENVAIVNALYAKRFLRGNPLEQTVVAGLKATSSVGPLRIIGVVGDTRQSGPQEAIQPIIYVPVTQVSDELLSEMREFLPIRFFVKTRISNGAVMAHMADQARQMAPLESFIGPSLVTDEVEQFIGGEKEGMKVAGVLGILAAIVAGLGLYSVTAVSVASRKRDLAIEAALGASARTILTHLLGNVVRQIFFGLVAGELLGGIAAKFIEKQLGGFAPLRIPDAMAILTGLLVLGVGACVRPALSGARVNPAAVLRES